MTKLNITELSETEMHSISGGYRTKYINMDLSNLVSVRFNIGIIVVAASNFVGNRTLRLNQDI